MSESALSNTQSQREMRRQFARLWNTAQKSVQAYVFSLVPSFHDAEDLIQQIAEEVAVHFDEYDPQRSFEAWVIWRAKLRVIDHFRKAGRDRLIFDEALVDAVAKSHISLSSTINDRAEALEFCIDQLPNRSRRMLDLRYVDGLKPAEIAEQLGSTSGSVRTTLLRLRDALADCITRRMAVESPA